MIDDPLRDARRRAFADQPFIATLTDQLLTSDFDGTPAGVSAGPTPAVLQLHVDRMIHDLAAASDPRQTQGVLADWLDHLGGDLALYANVVGAALVEVILVFRSEVCADPISHGEALWKMRVDDNGVVQNPM